MVVDLIVLVGTVGLVVGKKYSTVACSRCGCPDCPCGDSGSDSEEEVLQWTLYVATVFSSTFVYICSRPETVRMWGRDEAHSDGSPLLLGPSPHFGFASFHVGKIKSMDDDSTQKEEIDIQQYQSMVHYFTQKGKPQ